MLKRIRKNKKGFTLAELLIVVAIIGVLVAISIPIFTSQLEKSRDAVSVANIRSAYAQAQTAILTYTKDGTDGDVTITKLTTGDGGYTVAVAKVNIKSQKADNWSGEGNELPWVKAGDDGTVTVTPADPGTAGEKTLTFTYDKDYNITNAAFS